VYTKAFLFNRRSAMHRSVPLHLCALAFIALLGFPDTAPARQVSDSDTRIMSVAGVKETEQHRTIFQIRIAVRSGEDPDAARREALATFEANDAGPADFAAAGYSLTGPVWGQFFTHPRSDDVLVQRYNPAHAPAGLDVVQALLNAQATWTDVRSSRFRFEYGGQTTEPIVEGDGISDVGWLDPEPPPPPPPPRPRLGFLAVTLMTFDRITGRFIDADVFINPGVMWTTDGTGLDLEEVILHEEGHVAGLDHVLDSTSVMYPASRPDDLLRTLNDGDIDGITILYPRTPAKPLSRRDPSATYRLIATIGDSIPSRTALTTTFEPGGLNARGDVAFAASLADRCTPSNCTRARGQGAFIAGHRGTTQVARTEQRAPGGLESAGLEFFADGTLGRVALNDKGDAAFAFALDPTAFFPPFGQFAGVYRYDSSRGALDVLISPFVTPATGCILQNFPEIPCTFIGGSEADMNGSGDVVFNGAIATEAAGINGIFVADHAAHISNVVVPGDPAPDGGSFDYASSPSINDAGDIAFDAHRTTEACIGETLEGYVLYCDSSVYLRRAGRAIEAVARQGDPAPGGGTFRSAVNPVLNNRGQVLFSGDLTAAPDVRRTVGLFLLSGGAIVPVVRPGTPLPGGGHLRTTTAAIGFSWPLYWLNDNGAVVFNASLDTDEDEDDIPDTGIYVWEQGSIRLIARTGTAVPGLGVIAHIQHAQTIGSSRSIAGAIINNRGQVLFQAILTDGRGVLLIAEP
jgi:hypothetical protein